MALSPDTTENIKRSVSDEIGLCYHNNNNNNNNNNNFL